MLLSMYFSNSTSATPPFSFIPIVHGQILSSPQPNLPHVSKVWIKNSNRIFSLSLAVALVGNWKCGGTHLPAARCCQIFPCRRVTILPWTCLSTEGGDRGTTRPACHPLSCCSR